MLSLIPGTLSAAAAHRVRAARATGALQPIPTRRRFVVDGGVRFLVHVMASLETKENELARRRRTAESGTKPANPFLPYDPALFVADLSPTHLCLLNKYSVIDKHLLIVTRAFEDQETPLSRADLLALALCLDEIDGLGFFNGGTVAGASQPHKHLQLVPLPLVPPPPAAEEPRLPLAAEEPRLPVEPLLADAVLGVAPGEARIARALPFSHALCRLDGYGAEDLVQAYGTLLAATGLAGEGEDVPADDKPLPPYNLLVTRTWMLLVPRARERVEGISLNALGYAGSLFVRDESQLALVETTGPMRMLQAAGMPAGGHLL